MSDKTILLIDDDQKLAELLTEFFLGYHLRLISAPLPHLGLERLKENPDLVILDVMMPEMDGFEVCRRIRKMSNIPIIMLTARGDTTDRIVGLELGADDYLPKPFEPRELVARIQSILRRADTQPIKTEKLIFGQLEIDPHKRHVEFEKSTLDLTTMEYELLLLLTQNPGKKFDRDEIMNHLRGIDSSVYSRSIDILVSRLRQKIGDSPKNPRYIQTVWGTGYVFLSRENP